jgi:hypothetical protein
MGTSGRPSITKRQKEQVRLERQRDKAAKRQQRKVDKQNGVVAPSDEVEGENAGPLAEPTADEPAA